MHVYRSTLRWKQHEVGFQIDVFSVKSKPEVIDISPGNFHQNSMKSNFLLKKFYQNINI